MGLAKTQETLDKQRKHIEDSIQRMQVDVVRFVLRYRHKLVFQVIAHKSEGKTGMIASRKKKLERLGAEKVILRKLLDLII